MRSKEHLSVVCFTFFQIIFISAFFVSCSSQSFVKNGQNLMLDPEGWVDDNTYQLWLEKRWPTDTYYLVDIGPFDLKKLPLEIADLRRLVVPTVLKESKKALKAKLLTKLLSYYQNYTTYPADIRQLGELLDLFIIENDALKVDIVKEVYTRDGKANHLLQFNVNKFKFIVDETIIDLIEKQPQTK